MNNFKRTLEDQQKINEAVQAIFEHFSRWACYSEHIEVMSKAQTAIMVMTAHYHSVHLSRVTDDGNPKTLRRFAWANTWKQINGFRSGCITVATPTIL